MIKQCLILLTLVSVFTFSNSVSAQDNQAAYSSEEVDVKPTFPGGKEAFRAFIQKNVKYPIEARVQNQKGVVYIKYLVKSDGTITQVKFDRIMELILDENGRPKETKKEIETIKTLADESVRVVKLFPKHKPGQKNGHAVAVEMETRLTFFAAGK